MSNELCPPEGHHWETVGALQHTVTKERTVYFLCKDCRQDWNRIQQTPPIPCEVVQVMNA